MSKDEVRTLLENHNNVIENFINVELPKQLNVVNGKISMRDWFKGNQIIQEQGFYKKGMEVLNECRNNGYDVKMDMQSNKLVWYGGMI